MTWKALFVTYNTTIIATTISNHLESTKNTTQEICFQFLPRTEVFAPISTVPAKLDLLPIPTSADTPAGSTSTTTELDTFLTPKVTSATKRKYSFIIEEFSHFKPSKMRTKATPIEKETKKFSPTKTTGIAVKKTYGNTSLSKPVTRGSKITNAVTDQVREETPDMNADTSTDDLSNDTTTTNTTTTIDHQIDFSPDAATPEWVLTFQRQFRAHDQRLTSLESATAEIVRLQNELEATKIELAASNAQVASLQKQLLVRTDSGSSASKYASLPPSDADTPLTQSDFPALPYSKPRIQQRPNTATTTTSSSNRNGSSQKKKRAPVKTLLRMFELPRNTTTTASMEENDHLYQYVYVPNKYRKKLAKYRADLRQLGFDSGRILDVHYPAKGVAAILIHSDYSNEFHNLLNKHKVQPLSDFDPFAPANLNDPAFAEFTLEERAAKAKALQQSRLARGIQHLRPYLRGAVGHSFVQQGFLTVDQVKVILAGGSLGPNDNNELIDCVMMDSPTPSQLTFPSPLVAALGDVSPASAGNGEPALTQ